MRSDESEKRRRRNETKEWTVLTHPHLQRHCMRTHALDGVWARQAGQKFLKAKIGEIQGPNAQLPEELLYWLVFVLKQGGEALSRQFATLQKVVPSLQPNHPDMPPTLAPLVQGAGMTNAGADEEGAGRAETEDHEQAHTPASVPVATILQELGYACGRKTDLVQVLGLFVPLDETSVSQILGMMCRTLVGLDVAPGVYASFCSANGLPDPVDEPATSWDPAAVVQAVQSVNPDLNWETVMSNLDHKDFWVPDSASFLWLVHACDLARPDEPFPLDTVLGRIWNNKRGQVTFLKYAVDAPADVFTFAHSQRLAPPLEGIAGGKSPIGTSNFAWLCLELLETLVVLADSGQMLVVRSILEKPLQMCPEVLAVSMAGVNTWGTLKHEVMAATVPSFVLGTNASSSLVLHRLWSCCRNTLVSTMVELYMKDRSIISRILDVCQELKCLPEVLAMSPYIFAIELACLATRREYLNLEKWLQDMIAKEGTVFVQCCVRFLADKLQADASVPKPPAVVTLPLETLAMFVRVLQGQSAGFPPEILQEIKQISELMGTSFPQLAEVGSAAEMAVLEEVFAPDIEEEANAYFQKIYTGQQSVDDVIAMLGQFRSAEDERKQRVFACMVHNLLDEYRFFPKYPDKELRITAVLFGRLVECQLVSSVTLGIALRYVLEALKKPMGSKMFTFGVEALSHFKDRLAEWPQYCSHLLQIPQLRQAAPELVDLADKHALGAIVSTKEKKGGEEVDAPSSSQEESLLQDASTPILESATAPTAVPSSSFTPSASPKPQASQPSSQVSLKVEGKGSATLASAFATSLNIDTLVSAAREQKTPDQETLDKIHFTINNLSLANVDAKGKEVEAILRAEWYPWFAQYMVVKRASIEPNFHPLYFALLEKLNKSQLYKMILKATHDNIRVLLQSEKIKTNSGERSLLKNLGSWLGQLTIARNKPLLFKDLDIVSLIYDAYQTGRMIAVLPFVSKVVEPVKMSKVFRPPNPWTTAILQLFAEIYSADDLKLNLKFEIEMLFKSMKDMSNTEVKISDMKPTINTLKNYQRAKVDNPDFAMDKSSIAAAKASGSSSESAPQSPRSAATSAATAKDSEEREAASAGPVNLQAFVQVSPQLAAVAERLQLKRLVPVAVDRAIREVISPVVERSVTIACMTTRELVLKDFSMEGDDDKLRKAAYLMASSLAGSLALVTCKEPFRSSLATALRQLLQPAGLEQQALEQAVQLAANGNLDLGCALIEKAATDKAVRDIDEALNSAYVARRKAASAGQQFADVALLTQTRFPQTLPDVLRPKPCRLSPRQLRLYEDYAKIGRTIVPQAGGSKGTPGTTNQGGVPRQEIPLPDADKKLTTTKTEVPPLQATPFSTQQVLEKISMCMARVEAVVQKDPNAAFEALPPDNDLRLAVGEMIELMSKSGNRDEVIVAVAVLVLKKLYEGVPRRLGVGVYLGLLKSCKQMNDKVPRELTKLFGSLSEEQQLNRDLAELLIGSRLLLVPEFDALLVKHLQGPRFAHALELAVQLIRQCVVAKPVVSPLEMAGTLDVLSKVANRPGAPEAIQQLIDRVRSMFPAKEAVKAAPGGVPSRKGEVEGLRQRVIMLFDEWTRIIDAPAGMKYHATFAQQVQQGGFLKDDETIEHMFGILTEICVAHCLSSASGAGQGQFSFVAVDALSRLIVMLSRFVGERGANGLSIRAGLLARALSAATTVLQRHAAERNIAFNSRPYFRLFAGILNELSVPDPQLDSTNFAVLTAFAGLLQATQPSRVPVFCFAWLELVSHRYFMPKLLLAPNQKGWSLLERLLTAILRFMEPQLRNAELSDPIRLLYRGVLRVLLVLLHDFPEFLCDHHFMLCDAIPSSCVQMRNLVLSAFPRNMRLPDPFTPNLKVDLLPEISQAPRIVVDAGAAIGDAQLRADIDNYLKNRMPITLMQDLKSRFYYSPTDAAAHGCRYNMHLINAVVLYIGMQAIQQLHNKASQLPVQVNQGVPMEMFLWLVAELDPEGRYMFLSSVANQLRYPNNHTHYYSCVLLYLFSESPQELVKEQITRVLLERLIVNRPHPWGLLITFIELIKNPRYSFWSHSFTRCAPEIERLFESVARSCMGAVKPGEEDVNSKIAASAAPA